MIVSLHNYLVVGAILFAIGAIGFLTRRNLIIMFLSVEMMLQGVAINLVAFGRYHGNYEGVAFTIFLLTVAACEAAISLALILAMYQRRKSLDVNLWHQLRESDQPAPFDEPDTTGETRERGPAFPRLTPAGVEPAETRQ